MLSYQIFKKILPYRDEHKLLDIVEASADVIIIFNKNFHVEYMNKAGRQFFTKDYARSDFSKASRVTMQAIKHALAHGIWRGENTLVKPNGETIIVSQTVIVHDLQEDGNIYFSSVYRDISDLKETEHKLECTISELNTFLYKISHDLKGPVATMEGLLHLAILETHDPAFVKYGKMLVEQSQKLQSVLSGLSHIVNIHEEDFRPVEITPWLEIARIIQSFEFMVNHQHIQFFNETDERLSVIIAKPLLQVIVSNLVENAIKFSSKTGRMFVKISAYFELTSGHLIVSVRDNGIGIPEEYQGKIFDLFFRANNSVPGAGIGLYLVKSCVERLKGRIEVFSEEENGSNFIVYLPCLLH